MSIFDEERPPVENRFIRNSPAMLRSIFGTEDIAPFWVADMDFAVADPITAELRRLVDRGQYAYEFNAEGVFEAIVGWMSRRHQLELDAGRFLQVNGVLTGIALLIRELTQEGDAVLIQVPAFHQFPKLIETAARHVVRSSLRVVDGAYRMDFDDLADKVRHSGVKAMILCNPHNPVGRVWAEDELRRLLEIVEDSGVTIISDEIHSDIIYPGHRFTSLMSLDRERHVALIGSPAKTFGMQSISNGYVYTGNADLLDGIRRVADSMFLSHGNALTTFATIAAFSEGDVWLDELLSYLKASADWIWEFVQHRMPGVSMAPVEGTYQIWLDFSACGLSEMQLKEVFATAGFGAAPGSWFGREETHCARVSIAAPRARIARAFQRLKVALDRAIEQRGEVIG